MKDPFKIKEGSIDDSEVSEFVKDRRIGDYLEFLFSKNSGSLKNFFTLQKVRKLFLIFIFLLTILFFKAFYLQIIKGDYYRNIAEGNRIKNDIIKANRGLIYDRFGNSLLKNVSYFFLYLDLIKIDNKEELIRELEEILDLSTTEILTRIDNKEGQVLLAENLDYELALRLMLLKEKYQALEVKYEPRRNYFSALGTAHILGYLGQVNNDDLEKGYNYYERIGKTGLEYIYEDSLRGEDGFRQIEVDAFLREKNIISFKEPQDGADLILTIDSKAQNKLFNIMEAKGWQYNKAKMAGLVLDQEGGILALVSLPSFDNNIFTRSLEPEKYSQILNDNRLPLLNRVISGNYPLGSIFKIIVGAAALEEELIDDSFTVYSSGGLEIGGYFFPDWRSEGHGLTNIYWALADSVNTFFYSLGGGNNSFLEKGLGVKKIINYAQKFSLGKILGIDLPGEVNGFLPSKSWKKNTFSEKWYLGDTYNLSIGQGYLLATPLQAGVLMSYFANKGLVYKPHLVKSINNKEIKKEILLTNLISSANLDIIRTGLRKTVESGTAQSMQNVAVEVAGKTGTAQFHNKKTPHSWFAGFAPYKDTKITIVILVEEGGDNGLAVIIAKEFLEWYFSQ